MAQPAETAQGEAPKRRGRKPKTPRNETPQPIEQEPSVPEENHNETHEKEPSEIQSAEQPEVAEEEVITKDDFSGVIEGEGVLEIMPDGFGFLRSADYNYLN